MCEERIVLQAVIDSSWKDKTKEATAQAGIQTASLATGFSGQPKRILSPAGKRERCRNCIIYNEHERQKYKVLVGLVLIGFPLFVYANADQFQALTVTVLATLEQLSERFSFGDKHSTVSFLHNNPSPTIEWVMIGAASLIILSQLLRLVEYFCFKLKI